jgi:hypothetical protein
MKRPTGKRGRYGKLIHEDDIVEVQGGMLARVMADRGRWVLALKGTDGAIEIADWSSLNVLGDVSDADAIEHNYTLWWREFCKWQ